MALNLIIIARDGVINEASGAAVKSSQKWKAIPGSLEAIARLNQAGYQVIITVNHSIVADQIPDIDMLNSIHRKMHDELERVGGHTDAIFFSTENPDDSADMLNQIADRFYSDLADVPVIENTPQAAKIAEIAGASSMIVSSAEYKVSSDSGELHQNIPVYNNLAEAVEALLNH